MNTFFIVAGVLAALVFFYGVVVYNRFIALGRLRDEAWSGILVQLKKRHDLVPNLVETVKAYAAHEKGLLEGLAARRSMLGSAAPEDVAREENLLSGLLGRVIALAEAYPELKANANFATLQASLAEIEESVQLARRYYNGTVRDYNILAESFPSLIIARIFKFEPAKFFELDDPAEGAVPKVNFA